MNLRRLDLFVFIFCLAPLLKLNASEELEFFEKKIRPILAEKCYSCHSAGAKKLKAHLQLDHRDHMLSGGDSGPIIVPGDIESSLLIESIRYHNEDLQMPPKERLNAEVVQDFETWVAAGAPWPEEHLPKRDGVNAEPAFDLQERFAEHWSWRPVQMPSVPEVTNQEKVRSDIDKFVFAKVEQAGLSPAADAPKAVWLRRVYFDLIGLPPSPGQLSAFLSDDTERAYEKVVDELLASPHFGEKWARHWMDLTRYADSYGHEFDFPIQFAHQYRDYLIRAFNQDVPYNQFIREHVAGDLLEAPRHNPEKQFNESILGTGFWYLHEATHAPTDVLGNEADIMDNQIDVFGKSFLGLTISCARCHDHKFDAISTADYYALTAYLHSSARQEVVIDENQVREDTLKELVSIQETAESIEVEQPPIVELSKHETIFEDFNGDQLPDGWSTTGEAFAMSGTRGGIRFNRKDTISVPGVIDSGMYGKAQIGILRSPTFEIATDHIHILTKSDASEIRLVIDNYHMNHFKTLLFKGTIDKNIQTKGQFVWRTLTGDLQKYRGHRAFLEFTDKGDGDILVDEIRFSPSPEPPKAPKYPEPPKLSAAQNRLIEKGLAKANRLPKPLFAIAMAEGTRENAYVYLRGSHRSLGDLVPARFLEALGGEEGNRLELANHIANRENPLTTRVIVNRIWHHLFGRGLVETVDDFGPMGQKPSHPDLLDWLAAEFVARGWSIKRLVRELVLSSVYRQSSQAFSPASLAEIDPSNILLSKMPVKRLSGEAIRDQILAVSGHLDRTMFGPPIPTHRTEFMTGRGGKKSGPLDGAGRRSIYGAIYRNFLSPFMLTFDTPSPFGPKGKRSVSNVPAQALVLMNDPFVVEQTKLWAESLESKNGENLVETIFVTALGRHPSDLEKEKSLRFLTSESSHGASRNEAIAGLAHVVFNMKEFIFIH